MFTNSTLHVLISLQKINFWSVAQLSRQNINFCTNQLSSTTCKIEILEEPENS